MENRTSNVRSFAINRVISSDLFLTLLRGTREYRHRGLDDEIEFNSDVEFEQRLHINVYSVVHKQSR